MLPCLLVWELCLMVDCWLPGLCCLWGRCFAVCDVDLFDWDYLVVVYAGLFIVSVGQWLLVD